MQTITTNDIPTETIDLGTDLNSVYLNFEDYLRLNTNLNTTTQRLYSNIFKRFVRTKGTLFTVRDINDFLTRADEKHYTYSYSYAMRHVLIAFGKKHLLDNLKRCKNKERKKTFPYIHEEIIDRLLNDMATSIIKKQKAYYRIAFCQYRLGLRFREALTLKIENIEFNKSTKFTYIKIIGKGGKARLVPIKKKYDTLLRQWISGRMWGYLFINNTHLQQSKVDMDKFVETQLHYYNEILYQLGNKYNITQLSSHYLRHLFSDRYLMNGGTLESLSRILGHSRLDTTNSYVSINDVRSEETLDKMD